MYVQTRTARFILHFLWLSVFYSLVLLFIYGANLDEHMVTNAVHITFLCLSVEQDVTRNMWRLRGNLPMFVPCVYHSFDPQGCGAAGYSVQWLVSR